MKAERTWVQTIFQPLLVAGMMASLAVSVVQLVQLLVPTWDGTYLTTVVFLTALEAMAASRLVRRYRLREWEWVSFRAGEIVLILVALKLGSYVARGMDAFLADLALWQKGVSYLFTIEYVVAIVLTLITWAEATGFERDLAELAHPNLGIRVDRAAIQSRLMGQFFRGGALLLVISGVTRFGVAGQRQVFHPPVPGIILNVLVYFVLGLVLLSQARLTVMQLRWASQEVPAAPDIGGRWSRASLAFIAIVGAISLLLPTSYSYGLLESLGLALGIIVQALTFLMGIVMFILTLPFLLMSRLMGGASLMERPSDLFPAPDTSPVSGGVASLWPLLRSLIFWALIVGMALYVLRSYLSYRQALLPGEMQVRSLLRRLWRSIISLWRQASGAAAEAIEPIRRRLAETVRERMPTVPRPTWHWRRLSSMSPRERVQYYYLSIVHRGEHAGRGRDPGETPYEYSAALSDSRPEVEPDLSELTEAFVEARYSPGEISEGEAGRVREYWLRVKRTLRRRLGPEDPSE